MKRNFSINSYFVSKWYGSAVIKITSYIPGYTNDNQVSFLLEERESGLLRYAVEITLSNIQLYQLWPMPEIRESSLCWKYRSFTSSPQIFLYPLESTPFHSQPLATTDLCFFFFIHIFLSECHTNGIIYYVALWVWLLSHTITGDYLWCWVSVCFHFILCIYFSEQHTIIWICYCLSVYQWKELKLLPVLDSHE